MTAALMGVTFAMAAGVFGVAGIAFFWITALAAGFLIALAIWTIEVLAAKASDALTRFIADCRSIKSFAEIAS